MTHAYGADFWLDVLHGVVDCEAGGYETAGGVYVHVDGLFGGLGEREGTTFIRYIILFSFIYVLDMSAYMSAFVCPHASAEM